VRAGTDGAGGDFCHRSTRAIQRPRSGIRTGRWPAPVRQLDRLTTHLSLQTDRLRAVARDNDVKMIVLQVGANDDP
jgi:hypothetical protein